MNDDIVLKIRRFNRFYLPVINLYESSYLHSDYSMTESRVLYELYRRKECAADDIIRELRIDKGYMSRIIKRFEKEELLERERSKTDARSYKIRLTEKGKHMTKELTDKANQGIREAIRHVPKEEYVRLAEAMETIERILAAVPEDAQAGVRQ